MSFFKKGYENCMEYKQSSAEANTGVSVDMSHIHDYVIC